MSSRPLSSYSIKELPPWAQAAAKEVPQLAEPPLLQGHALSTPAQHRPWAPLSVPSSWRLPPWETQTLYKMLLFRSLDENPLPIFGALLSKAKKNVLELLFPPVSALVLLLSEGVGKDALWELLEWRLQGCEIHQEHHNNTLCRIHLEQGRERIGSRKQSWAPETPCKMCPRHGTYFSKLQHCQECAGCETEHGCILHLLPKMMHLSVCTDRWEWESPFKSYLYEEAWVEFRNKHQQEQQLNSWITLKHCYGWGENIHGHATRTHLDITVTGVFVT